jgi:ubiquinone/menaquinone biosynthesis C-methylase UbiE
MIRDTISTEAARRLYDRLGARYDWAEPYEGRAKMRALEALDLAPGQQVLDVGVGTGKEHVRIQDAVTPGGRAFGLDLSRAMLDVTRARTVAPLCQADARHLPFPTASLDRLFSVYVLDLIPASDLPGLLAEFRRVLRPGGRMVLASLTEGVNLPSRAFVALWKMAYAVNPIVCGGCRPLELSGLVGEVGFSQVSREVVVQLGIPSEVLIATR